ncbi:DegQ family serine endoprotease [Pseudaminobacter sp. 19-2017]|uniref:Probable periplasmic serine endoprotease DegP-like n=2 Tax=Pseudaminobacter soli (ex Zhang et al. 2022) TaxID=2831468 RepID=A0A942IAR4_9HYPH|nr:DegQ family serine endoprotease [Pseudaminobacter soli]MBS3650781.1 DegQ family serine endoprotease [Pseudaminobacter soli]
MNMSTSNKPVSWTRSRLMAAAASIAIAGAIGVGAVTTGTAPVLAQAVKVEAPQVPSFADVVSQVSPAVVSVQVKSNVRTTSDMGTQLFGGQGFDDLPDDHPLKRFFREFRGDQDGGQWQQRRGGRERALPRPTAQGSGFFISEDGYLVTNNHVVDGGSEYTVVMDNGDELNARLIGKDARTDLAVLKVDADRKFTYVNFAEDNQVRVGDWVVAVGNPFGLGGTVTAGIVSARGRDIGAGPYDDFIQIDAAVNRGNSGGPAFDLKGEVVGINTAIFSPSGGSVGIAFAIPASTAKEVVKDLMDTGSVKRGWIGVQIQPVTKDIADSLGLSEAKGAIVSEPQANGPAVKAGIKSGDVITAVNGKLVNGPRELARMIGSINPGETVEVTLWRDGKSQNVQMTLGELPETQQQASTDRNQQQKAEPSSLADLGLTVAPADDGKGLVVTDVDPQSDAADRGIQPGDIITSVNSREVNGAQDITSALADAEKSGRKAVLMQITRDNGSRFVALPIARS